MEDKNTYLNKINIFYSKYRRLPSYSEIMVLTGLRSKNAVHGVVKKLITQGMLAKDEFGKIVPGRLFGAAPLLGVVEAGFPSAAEEELVDTISFDEFLISNKQATYILKVSGDSMVGAGILPGDLVVVERGRTPRSGDIVIAEVDSQWTMKYLRKVGKKTYLEAANGRYPKFVPKDELKITAVVTSVVRKY